MKLAKMGKRSWWPTSANSREICRSSFFCSSSKNNFPASCLNVFTLRRHFIWASKLFHVFGPRIRELSEHRSFFKRVNLVDMLTCVYFIYCKMGENFLSKYAQTYEEMSLKMLSETGQGNKASSYAA